MLCTIISLQSRPKWGSCNLRPTRLWQLLPPLNSPLCDIPRTYRHQRCCSFSTRKVDHQTLPPQTCCRSRGIQAATLQKTGFAQLESPVSRNYSIWRGLDVPAPNQKAQPANSKLTGLVLPGLVPTLDIHSTCKMRVLELSKTRVFEPQTLYF